MGCWLAWICILVFYSLGKDEFFLFYLALLTDVGEIGEDGDREVRFVRWPWNRGGGVHVFATCRGPGLELDWRMQGGFVRV